MPTATTTKNEPQCGFVCKDKDGRIGIIFQTSQIEGADCCLGFCLDGSSDVWSSLLEDIEVIDESLNNFFINRVKEEISEDVKAITRAVESCIKDEIPKYLKVEYIQEVYDALSNTIIDKADSRAQARDEAGMTLIGGQDIGRYVKKVHRKTVGSLS